jgi:hypothetical protein
MKLRVSVKVTDNSRKAQQKSPESAGLFSFLEDKIGAHDCGRSVLDFHIECSEFHNEKPHLHIESVKNWQKKKA